MLISNERRVLEHRFPVLRMLDKPWEDLKIQTVDPTILDLQVPLGTEGSEKNFKRGYVILSNEYGGCFRSLGRSKYLLPNVGDEFDQIGVGCACAAIPSVVTIIAVLISIAYFGILTGLVSLVIGSLFTWYCVTEGAFKIKKNRRIEFEIKLYGKDYNETVAEAMRHFADQPCRLKIEHIMVYIEDTKMVTMYVVPDGYTLETWLNHLALPYINDIDEEVAAAGRARSRTTQIRDGKCTFCSATVPPKTGNKEINFCCGCGAEIEKADGKDFGSDQPGITTGIIVA